MKGALYRKERMFGSKDHPELPTHSIESEFTRVIVQELIDSIPVSELTTMFNVNIMSAMDVQMQGDLDKAEMMRDGHLFFVTAEFETNG